MKHFFLNCTYHKLMVSTRSVRIFVQSFSIRFIPRSYLHAANNRTNERTHVSDTSEARASIDILPASQNFSIYLLLLLLAADLWLVVSKPIAYPNWAITASRAAGCTYCEMRCECANVCLSG